MGVVTMIESFPARSQACQNAEGPQDPLERAVCRKRRESGAGSLGGGLHEGEIRK